MVKEGHLLAIFNSTHKVMKAETVLKAIGLPILLIPAPRQIQTDCGLAIRFNEDIHEQLFKLLEKELLLPAFITAYRQGSFVTIWTVDETTI